MDLFEILGQAITSESVALASMLCFLGFGVYIINKVVPAGERVFMRFVDDVFKPLVPVFSGAIDVLATQGEAIAAQNKSSEQLVEAVQDSQRTTRELFEMRIAQEAQERVAQVKAVKERSDAQIASLEKKNEAQVKALRSRIKELETERDKLKAELAEVKDERDDLKKRLDALEAKEKAGDDKKA